MTEEHDLMLERSALLTECAKLREDISDAIERVNEIDRVLSVGYTAMSHSQPARVKLVSAA